ncbi:hypothetical protein BBJ29_007678 [Phytophthora kernoviae]|uniref:Tyrosinase copper-binding domain-containing protein n=1 Tax=Phytophthora kernoviae TaxID=325452 RepID=A0A3F2RSS3_9STRA|nr:hypothetical protein BBJ29_007678 [Phytophthora kernoviae]RLN62503.1 hypothetical protein BBP00_00004722 [Phytophthora kernoviae]
MASCLLLVLLCILVPTSTGQQIGTNCAAPRIRKSWEKYNATEKALYLEAVGVAMDKGYHLKFIQLHTETLSGNEAHQNCMFIYWHRMMLLGYENMLRSLDDRYKCITLPYWDHLAATARRTSGTCSDLQSCSPIITESGGTTSYSTKTKNLNIFGTTITPYSTELCINQAPHSHFCANNTVCAQCVIRKKSTSMASTAYPGEASFASVYQQVFYYNDSASFSNAVERGVHNTIHNALGGVMAYLQAPADLIFYSHHALVDLLQIIYLKCQNGGEDIFLSATTKSSDSRFWNACARKSSGTVYTPADNVTMRVTGFDGRTFVNVWQDPKNVLYPFFKDLPTKYSDLVDAKDLGNYSYTYNISGALANMYTNCWASNTINSASFSLMSATRQESEGRRNDDLRPIISPGTEDDDTVKRWTIALYEAARIVGYEEWAAREQMETVICQYQEDCLGGVVDFTDLYRTNFGIEGHTRCFSVVEELKTGYRAIGIPNWKGITSRFLRCSKYNKQDTSPYGAITTQ